MARRAKVFFVTFNSPPTARSARRSRVTSATVRPCGLARMVTLASWKRRCSSETTTDFSCWFTVPSSHCRLTRGLRVDPDPRPHGRRERDAHQIVALGGGGFRLDQARQQSARVVENLLGPERHFADGHVHDARLLYA